MPDLTDAEHGEQVRARLTAVAEGEFGSWLEEAMAMDALTQNAQADLARLLARAEAAEAALNYSNKAREIMRAEKEHGWREAEKWEARAEAAEAERDVAIATASRENMRAEAAEQERDHWCADANGWQSAYERVENEALALQIRAEAAEAELAMMRKVVAPDSDGHACIRVEAYRNMSAELAKLREALREAANDVEDYAQYAGDHLSQKWNVASDVARYRTLAGGVWSISRNGSKTGR